MIIIDHREQYNEEIKIHPRPAQNYTAATSKTEQKGTAF